jgi:hypothetical protein
LAPLPLSIHVNAKLEQQADYRLVAVLYRGPQRSISKPTKIRVRRTNRPSNHREICSGVSTRHGCVTRQLHSHPRHTRAASVQQRNAIRVMLPIHSRCKTAVGSGTHAAIATRLAGATLLGDLLKHTTLMKRRLVVTCLLPRPPAHSRSTEDTEDHQTSDLAEIQSLLPSAAVTAAALDVFLCTPPFPFAIAAQSFQKTLLCALPSRQ